MNRENGERPLVNSTANDGFNAFWKVFPQKVGKKAAWKVYDKTVRSGEATIAELLAGARRYAREREGQLVGRRRWGRMVGGLFLHPLRHGADIGMGRYFRKPHG